MKIDKLVKEILLNDWDPIGIKNDPKAKSEYDTYALRIVGMLFKGINEKELSDYLKEVVEQELGLKVNTESTKIVTQKLLSLEIKEPFRGNLD